MDPRRQRFFPSLKELSAATASPFPRQSTLGRRAVAPVPVPNRSSRSPPSSTPHRLRSTPARTADGSLLTVVPFPRENIRSDTPPNSRPHPLGPITGAAKDF